jgi:hypothetical protein
MLVLRRRAASLLLTGGIIGAGIAIGAPSGYGADTGLAVSPRQGSPDAQFAATYRWPATKGRRHSTVCAPGEITFEWDGSLLGRATPTQAGGTCVATLRATPPQRTYRGATTHAISVTSDRSARATYTVTERTAASPSADASPAVTDSTTDPAGDPAATDLAGAPAASAGPTAPTVGQNANSGASFWLIAFGTTLFLAGVGMFGMIAWRARHPKPDAQAPRPSPDNQTQPRAPQGQTPRRAAHRARRG